MNVKKLISYLLVMALFVPTFAYAQQEQLQIVCTSFPCYDFARAVAGENADIRLLIKPGAEVHTYEPTPADVLSIASCDLFIYIGGESDAWVVDILESFGEDAPKTLRFFDSVEEIESVHTEKHHDHDEHSYDEHIWTAPSNAVRMIEALEAELCFLSPEKSAEFEMNAGNYIGLIEEIDNDFKTIVENGKRREMIFADRFPFIYFTNEYGIEWKAAFDSCSSESEPSARVMMELIDRVIRDGIPVIYTIELSNGKTAKTIADETGAEICTFHSVQNVTEADFSAGETYVSLMRKNVDALEKGLY